MFDDRNIYPPRETVIETARGVWDDLRGRSDQAAAHYARAQEAADAAEANLADADGDG